MLISEDTRVIAVFGGNEPDGSELVAARLFGAQVNLSGAVLLTGGDGSHPDTVKDAAIRSAIDIEDLERPAAWIGVRRADSATAPEEKGGRSILLTPGWDHRRNFVEACLCDAAIAIWGGAGTASEVVFCLYLRRPVVLIGDKWPMGPAAMQTLRDSATHRIEWPQPPQTAIDRGIAGAYEWADSADGLPEYAPLPATGAGDELDRATARIVDRLSSRISAVSAKPDLDGLRDERSWDAFVESAIVTAGR